MIPCHGQVSEQVEDVDILMAKMRLFVISIWSAKSAGAVIHIGVGDDVVFTFTGARGWGHVAGGRGLLGSASGSRTRAGLLVFLVGGDIKGLVLVVLLVLLLLDLGARGVLGVVALETFLHLAEALLEGGKFLRVPVDGSLPIERQSVRLGLWFKGK
jgi:hypothetical protein